MNFASPAFWGWLIACFLGARLVLAGARRWAPDREVMAAKLCLLGTALLLLAAESPLTLVVFLWVAGCGWLASGRRGSGGGVRFFILLMLQLAPLIYYKYWDFLGNEVLGLGWRVPSVLIPMGLSFYTFQTLGFWLDSRRSGEERPPFLDYLGFCSFFPQIVAGPIERRADLLPQIAATRFRLQRENLDEGISWILLGLTYKMVLADNLAEVAAGMNVDPASGWQVWLECFFFALRIYFDFAGYSFVALGLGLLLGVRLTLNFNSPYWSADLREFWRTWHITLGSWLRDYIYRPLGGRRSGRWVVNLLVVFLVSGIWHGAGWGFLAWGLLHGLGVVFCSWGKPWPLPGVIRWGVTLLFVVAGWLFFFERDTELLQRKAFALVDPRAYGSGGLLEIPARMGSASDLLLAAAVLGLAMLALAVEGIGKKLGLAPYELLRRRPAGYLLVLLLVLLASTAKSPFIYFNF